MNKKQIQMKICKAILESNTRLCKAKINDDEVMITTDGFVAFVLFEKECIFDLNKIPTNDKIAKFIHTNEADEEIFITRKRFVDRGFTIAKLQGESCTVYAKEQIVKMFEKYHLFTNKDKFSVVAKNDLGMTVGMFCAMRFTEEER